MNNKKYIYILCVVAFVAIMFGVALNLLKDRDSYVPEDNVSQMNYERSQEYVDGIGYKLDDYRNKEHKKQEKRKINSIVRKPLKKYVMSPVKKDTGGKRNRKPVEKQPEKREKKKPQKRKNKEEKQEKKEQQEEEPSEDPIINISIKNGEKVSGTTKKFTVTAMSFDGDDIPASKIVVKMNGDRLLEKGVDTYIGDILDGKNVIVVTATDSEGRKCEVTRTFTGQTKAPPKVIGKLNISITAKVLGIDIVAPEKSIDIYDNEQLSDVMERYLSKVGISVDGVQANHYEIGRIHKKGILVDIPEDIITKLEDRGIEIPDDKNSLGLNDFGAGSGWMYSVDGTAPNKYMDQMDPAPGSKVELYYVM